MLRFVLSFIGGFFTFITMGVMVGALSVGAVIWVYSQDLPSHTSLAQYQPPTISRIYSREGRIIDEFAQERRLFTPASDIPDLIKHAFISAEDKNFYNHNGFDTRGMASALIDAIKSRGANLRGASTITQQVMKNFLLSGDRRLERKIKEIILATRVEEALDKEKILELYLNEIFLGQNSYGVTAAAQTYFNKTLWELAPHEAAFLASLPKAPSDFHPVRRKDRLTQRRNFVLREMMENGYISKATYEAERALPLRSVQNGDFPSFRTALPDRDYFTDEIRRQLSQDFGEDSFFSGGYSVRATVDPGLQNLAGDALRARLEDYDREKGDWRGTDQRLTADKLATADQWQAALKSLDLPRGINAGGKWHLAVVLDVQDQYLQIGIEDQPDLGRVPRADIRWMKGNFFDNFTKGDVVYVRAALDDAGKRPHWSLRQIPQIQGAFMAMDVNTGRVLAMQGGFSYKTSVFNRATQAWRQPGSNFKPFVYAAALDSGYSPATIVIDAPIEVNTPEGLWTPKNAGSRFYGPTPMRTGIEQSRNLMTIRLAQELGMETIARYAEGFGLYDNMNPYLANALGAQETTLFRVVSAYAMFANGGERVEPTLVDRVQDRFGRTVYRHDARKCVDCDQAELPPRAAPRILSSRERIMDAITAYQLTSMMQGTVQRGTAAGVVRLDVPVAGKTGTTNEARDVWFTGFTSNIVAGCYMGFDVPRPLGRGAYGASMCGPVFQKFMTEAVKKYGGGSFHIPAGGHFINMDRNTGARLPADATGENVIAEFFRDGDEPTFGVTTGGGFAIGSNLQSEQDTAEETEPTDETIPAPTDGAGGNFGSISSGGLY